VITIPKECTPDKTKYWFKVIYLQFYAEFLVKELEMDAKEIEKIHDYLCDPASIRNADLEVTLASFSGWIYFYARDILKSRWTDVEPLITDLGFAVLYSQHIMKGRFPYLPMEAKIMENEHFSKYYIESMCEPEYRSQINPMALEVLSGKLMALGRMIGKVREISGGKADPKLTRCDLVKDLDMFEYIPAEK